MLNQVVLVGRIASDIKLQEIDKKEKVATVTLAVPRNIKNSDGLYDTDFIDCTLLNGVATNATENCVKGNIVGVKGRLTGRTSIDEIGTNMALIAEKITFLSSKQED